MHIYSINVHINSHRINDLNNLNFHRCMLILNYYSNLHFDYSYNIDHIICNIKCINSSMDYNINYLRSLINY